MLSICGNKKEHKASRGKYIAVEIIQTIDKQYGICCMNKHNRHQRALFPLNIEVADRGNSENNGGKKKDQIKYIRM